MNKIVIIQPAVSHYRVGFFDKMVELTRDEFKLYVFTSPVADTGAKSVKSINSEIDYEFVPLIKIANSFFWQPVFSKVWRKGLSKGDTLVICGNPRYLCNIALGFLLKLKRVNIVWWGHAMSSSSSELGSFIRFKLMNFCNVIFYTDKEVNEHKHKLKNNVCALNNGLDVEKIRSKYILDRTKYSSEKLKLVFLGRLTEKSKFKLLLSSLLSISKEKLANIELHVIGDLDQEKLAEFDKSSSNLNIMLHGEVWEESEVTKLMGECHVFVYPGAVGLSLIHAFALGLPALLHNSTNKHMPEIAAFENNQNGVLFEFDDVKSLSEKIVWMLENKDELAVMSEHAYSTVSNSYNTTDMAKRFVSFIKDTT